MINTKKIVVLVCIAVLSSLAHANIPMGSAGVEDVIYAHSSGGYGAIYWQQYDATGANIGNKFICNTPGQDIGYINSITARANNNGNINMIYLVTNAGWSDVRLQQLDTSGNLVGATQFLEFDSADGFRKFYTGVDVGIFANGDTAIFLSGLNAQGNSVIYLSTYSGNVRQSQSVLKSFTSNIGIGDVAISDIDSDGAIELLYVTSASGIANVARIDLDTAGNIVSETPNYVTVDLSWGATFTCKALSIGQVDGDAEKELLVAMSRPDQGMETYTLAYQMTTPVVYPTTAFSAETLGTGLGGFMWQGVSIVNFSGETITLSAPVNCEEAIFYGYGEKADINTDCKIDFVDMGMLAGRWHDCTLVDNANCVQLPVPLLGNPIHRGIVTVDGSLSDWAEADWIAMDQVCSLTDDREYFDVNNAKWSAKWDPATNLIYVAVVVEDSNHFFNSTYSGWARQDSIEVYINADVSTLEPYSPYDPTAAQMYVIGSSNGGEAEWAVYGDGVAMPAEMLPAYAVSVVGNTISYEIAVKPYQEVSPGWAADISTSTIMPLTVNMAIGLDVIANTKWGSDNNDFALLGGNVLVRSSAYTKIDPTPKSGGAGLLNISGLFHDYYEISTIATEMGMSFTESPIKIYQGNWDIPLGDFSDLGKYDVIFLTDVPLWALGANGVKNIEAYVSGGGTLVFLDGPFVEGYAGSLLETILPVTLGDKGFGKIVGQSLILDRTYFEQEFSDEVYFMQGRLLKNGAQVIASIDDQVIGAKNRVGLGRVIYFSLLPLTDSGSEDFVLWKSIKWTELLSL